MDSNAQKIYNIISSKDFFESDIISKSTKNIIKKYPSVLNVIKDLLYSDDTLFDVVFFINFTDKKKIDIISNYLSINRNNIICSKDLDEILTFCSSTFLCEGLSKMFKTIEFACSVNLNDFIYMWYMFNLNGDAIETMVNKNNNIDDFSLSVKNNILKYKNKEVNRKEN